MIVLSKTADIKGEVSYWMWCPGCDQAHAVGVGPNGWEFNGDMDKPTFSPSILVTQPPAEYRCHSYIRDGQWQFLEDCTHELRGQTVDMVQLPKWLVDEESEA